MVVITSKQEVTVGNKHMVSSMGSSREVIVNHREVIINNRVMVNSSRISSNNNHMAQNSSKVVTISNSNRVATIHLSNQVEDTEATNPSKEEVTTNNNNLVVTTINKVAAMDRMDSKTTGSNSSHIAVDSQTITEVELTTSNSKVEGSNSSREQTKNLKMITNHLMEVEGLNNLIIDLPEDLVVIRTPAMIVIPTVPIMEVAVVLIETLKVVETEAADLITTDLAILVIAEVTTVVTEEVAVVGTQVVVTIEKVQKLKRRRQVETEVATTTTEARAILQVDHHSLLHQLRWTAHLDLRVIQFLCLVLDLTSPKIKLQAILVKLELSRKTSEVGKQRFTCIWTKILVHPRGNAQ